MQLYLECPCSSFPRSFARDFKETYLYPPPSTIYGMLLSLVGEMDLQAHIGVKIAIGIIGADSPISRIVRKQRHHKFSKAHAGTYPTSQFSKPNHQELLTDLKIAIAIDSRMETATIKLSERIATMLSTPSQIRRFGGLSLGESWALVNGIRAYRESDGDVRWLVRDRRGLIGLPVWIDRSTTQGTFERFTLGEFSNDCFVPISPPVALTPPKTPKATRKQKSE